VGDISWMDVAGTTIVLVFAGGIVGAMGWVVRISTDDSGRHAELKAFMETLFETPAHLRPGSGADSNSSPAPADNLAKPQSQPFQDTCPACSVPVTQDNTFCPSCDLRLM
jgi:hypothetical protein